MIKSQKRKEATYLLTLRQESKESLKSYVDRFRNATLEVYDLQVGVAVTAMLQGTMSEKLQESLSLDQSMTILNLFSRANKYITQEEVMKMIPTLNYI